MSSNKYNYIVETPHGVFKRSSTKEYTHAVVSVGEVFPVDSKVEQVWKSVKLCEFCSRSDLATKLHSRYINGKASWGVLFKGVSEIHEVKKV